MNDPKSLSPQEFYDQRLPFAQAWREGKVVQCTKPDGTWFTVVNHLVDNPGDFFFSHQSDFRFPPAVTFIEWTGPQDVPLGAVFRSLDNPGVWRTPITISPSGLTFMFPNGLVTFTWKEILNDYEWSRDGKEWTTCGTRQEGSTLNREL